MIANHMTPQEIDAKIIDILKKKDMKDNEFFRMVNSGSKGNWNNFKSVSLFLGEQRIGYEKYPL